MSLKVAFGLVKETLAEWTEDKAPRLGAALAYYTVFSLAPLLIIAIAIAGLVIGEAAAQGAIVDQFRGLLGQPGAELIESMIAGAQKPTTSILATILGVVTLTLGALGVFGQLQDALNTIWEVRLRPRAGMLGFLKGRLLSLTMVLAVGFLLLVSLALSAALGALGAWLGGWLPDLVILLNVVNFLVSFAVITVLFALMFKTIPDARIAWGDVWIGAAITSLMFVAGKQVIGAYLGNADIGSSYGAAGSLVVLLLWVYYSTQIFFLGAEFTQVYANRLGSLVVPKEEAVRVGEGQRAEEGIPRKQADAGGQRAARAGAAGLRRPADLAGPLVGFIAGVGAGAIVALRTIREGRSSRDGKEDGSRGQTGGKAS